MLEPIEWFMACAILACAALIIALTLVTVMDSTLDDDN